MIIILAEFVLERNTKIFETSLLMSDYHLCAIKKKILGDFDDFYLAWLI